MNQLVIHRNQHLVLDPEVFTQIDLDSFYNIEPSTPVEKLLKEISEKDLLAYRVSQKIIELNSDFLSIIMIKINLEWFEILRIGIYLRLYPGKFSFPKLPIIYCCDQKPDPLTDQNLKNLNDIFNYAHEDGFFYKGWLDLFGQRRNEEGTYDYGIGILLRESVAGKEYHGLDINVLSYHHINDRHSITNQWGAVKLALNAGYTADEIDYNFPPTLYFNSLLKKYGSNSITDLERITIQNELGLITENNNVVCLSSLLKQNKILLIDDNADKGWHQVLQKIFNCSISKKKTLIEVSEIPDYDYALFDLVFLDLYLPNPLKSNIPDMEYSKKLLKGLKERYPQIPIIIFTASNKSWTLTDVMNMGADGMYVKESPEFAEGSSYSKENFKNFLNTVVTCLKRYHILRPYWNFIEKAKHNFLPEIIDEPTSQIKSRIEERLVMFYGLLKRGFEQRQYDREIFYFSDYELAFMTLWSILNEICESYYEKNQSSTPVVNFTDRYGVLLNHPDGTMITSPTAVTKEMWHIKHQPNEILFQYEWNVDFDRNGIPVLFNSRKYRCKLNVLSFIKYDGGDPSGIYYNIAKNDYNPNKTIHCQIAFLILKKIDLSTITNPNTYLSNLKQLSEVRNKLYLTHGESVSSGYYAKTEEMKRIDNDHNILPNGDLKQLFELVIFLLTAEEILLPI